MVLSLAFLGMAVATALFLVVPSSPTWSDVAWQGLRPAKDALTEQLQDSIKDVTAQRVTSWLAAGAVPVAQMITDPPW